VTLADPKSYDLLLNLLVEQIVLEIEQDAEIKTPVGNRIPIGASINSMESTANEEYPRGS
jgi:hypothetical protein